jgi:hypothetical protein
MKKVAPSGTVATNSWGRIFKRDLRKIAADDIDIPPTTHQIPISEEIASSRRYIPHSPIEIANNWMEDTLINPYTLSEITLSVHNKSEYVEVYKKIITNLLTVVGKSLTIDDCKFIKNNLPIIHSFITIGEKSIRYDHLFIKYFIKRRGLIYDKEYLKDSEIKLYLQIYNAIKRKNGMVETSLLKSKSKSKSSSSSFANDNYITINDLLKDNVELGKTDLSIRRLIIKLCIDMLPILYMRNSDYDITIPIALRNKKILQYVKYFYVLGFAKGSIRDDIDTFLKELDNVGAVSMIFSYLTDSGVQEKDIETVYTSLRTLVSYLKGKDSPYIIFDKLIDIYDTILFLYGKKNIIYESIKEDDIIKDDDISTSIPYCRKDEIDPLSLEDVSELVPNMRKYVSTIYYYNKETTKVHYYCFDTRAIYNYILSCIEKKKHPLNLYLGKVALSDDDLDEICNKIKKLTKKPTYNSHIDIINAIKRGGLPSIKITLSYTKGEKEYTIYINYHICEIIISRPLSHPHVKLPKNALDAIKKNEIKDMRLEYKLNSDNIGEDFYGKIMKDLVHFDFENYNAILKEEVEYLNKISKHIRCKRIYTRGNISCTVQYIPSRHPSLDYSIKEGRNERFLFTNIRLFENHCLFPYKVLDDCMIKNTLNTTLEFNIDNRKYLECILLTLRHFNRLH